MMTATQAAPAPRLNPVQLHLLELFSREMSEAELAEIKELLLQYYIQKAESEVERAWAEKGFTRQSFKKATRGLHMRGKKQRTAA